MEIVNSEDKKKYNGSRNKTMPMLISFSMIFLLLGMAIGSSDVSYTEGAFWSRTGDTLVLTNNSENVNIGENTTTDYRLKINGTSYFNDTMIVNGVINANGGDSSDWNNAYGWGDHSLLDYLTNWNDGDPFFNNSDAFHVTSELMENWNESGGVNYWNLSNGEIQLKNTSHTVNISNDFVISTTKYIANTTNWNWDINFTNYKILTVESDYIDSNLDNFPLLVVLDNSTGDYTFHNNGADIEFLSLDNTTQFNHEIESFNNTGVTICWVNISETLTSGTDYNFLVYYNNSADFTVNHNPESVWDSNYLAVWHMNSLLDSTSNDIDLTNDGAITDVNGKIGVCYDFEFDETDSLYHNTFLDSGFDVLSMECWANHESNLNGNYISKRNISGEDRVFFRRDAGSLSLFLEATNSGTKTATGGVIADETWVYTFGSYSKGSELRVFLNTVESLGNIQSNSFRSGTTDHFLIGKLNSVASTNAMDGLIDEIRISGIVRSDSWVNASYHSQNQTGGFITFGNEITLETYIEDYNITTNIFTVDVNTEGNQIIFNNSIIYLKGDSRITRHIRLTAPTWVKGVSEPTVAFIGITPVLSFDKSNDDAVHYSIITPFRIETNSNVTIYVDWCYTGANDDGTVTWNLSYINIDDGDSVDGTLSYVAQTTTGTHINGKLVRTVFSENLMGAIAHNILSLRLIRDISEDTLDTDAHLIQVHFMFTEDKLGEPV